ncbi:hypothetical protein [Solemya velesiana gill symbiont]|nr:hypothetical protein [Solemya velesiana gill symbiont]
MTSENLLVEQRIREYEARLKHLDAAGFLLVQKERRILTGC